MEAVPAWCERSVFGAEECVGVGEGAVDQVHHSTINTGLVVVPWFLLLFPMLQLLRLPFFSPLPSLSLQLDETPVSHPCAYITTAPCPYAVVDGCRHPATFFAAVAALPWSEVLAPSIAQLQGTGYPFVTLSMRTWGICWGSC